MPAFTADADVFAAAFAGALRAGFAADFAADDFTAADFVADDFATVGFPPGGLVFATGRDFATGFLRAAFAAEVFDEALAMASSHCERENGSGVTPRLPIGAQATPGPIYHEPFQIVTKLGENRDFAVYAVTI